MLRRTLTSLLLIPPVLYLIGWSPKWLFLLAVVAAVELGLREFFALTRQMGYKTFPALGYVGGAALCVVQTLPGGESPTGATFLIMLLILLIPSLALQRSTDLRDYPVAVAVTLFGVLYIGLTLSCLVAIRFSLPPLNALYLIRTHQVELAVGSRLLLLLFLVIWAGDICAYLVGRSVGRTPFFARVSPRKTVEGAMGGLVGSLLAAWTFVYWYWTTADLKAVIFIVAWVALAGQIGDLVESALKRAAKQKDSGTLLPGHGGFLDRIDSLIFGAPALWLALVAQGLWS
jgi:phosphatidate cytidylyltransferase